MSDREGAEWLIRLAQAIEENGSVTSAVLTEGAQMTGLEFLQRLAERRIFVTFDPKEDKPKKRPKDEDDDWDYEPVTAKPIKKEPSTMFVIEAYRGRGRGRGRGKVYFTHQGGWTKYMGEARLYDNRDQAVRHASTNNPPKGYKDRVVEVTPRFSEEDDWDYREFSNLYLGQIADGEADSRMDQELAGEELQKRADAAGIDWETADSWKVVAAELERHQDLETLDWIIMTETETEGSDPPEQRCMTANKRWSKELRFAKRFPSKEKAEAALKVSPKQPAGWGNPVVRATGKDSE